MTNVEKARICSEINTKSILWGNIEGSYGTNHFITNRMRGAGEGGGGGLGLSCLIDFFSMSVGIQILFSHIR